MAWSGGKDAALALARLREDPGIEVGALLTTMIAGEERVNMHGVRRSLLQQQVAATGIDLVEVPIPDGAPNDVYEAAMTDALRALRAAEPRLRHVVFGDIFLADVRAYRERLAAACGFTADFPLWGSDTAELADEVLERGITARIVSVDTVTLPASFAGRAYDRDLLRTLPAGIDPCGERGEFHTFVSAAPFMTASVPYEVGGTVLRDGRFAWCDLRPAGQA
jgi:uncharacterized protein (TIGR00290 family)